VYVPVVDPSCREKIAYANKIAYLFRRLQNPKFCFGSGKNYFRISLLWPFQLV